MRVEATMGQPQCLHQGLQAGRTNAITAEACGGFPDDAFVGLGFVVL